MKRYAYPRSRVVAAVATDALLVAVVVLVLAGHVGGALGRALAVAIPLVLAWGVLSLHQPRVVELDDEGITFRAYGRAHRYLWRDTREVRVRRFLVRDRVMVRIVPAPPLAGRYWLLDSLSGFGDLVAALEARSKIPVAKDARRA